MGAVISSSFLQSSTSLLLIVSHLRISYLEAYSLPLGRQGREGQYSDIPLTKAIGTFSEHFLRAAARKRRKESNTCTQRHYYVNRSNRLMRFWRRRWRESPLSRHTGYLPVSPIRLLPPMSVPSPAKTWPSTSSSREKRPSMPVNGLRRPASARANP